MKKLELSGLDHYALFTALRGPDHQNTTLTYEEGLLKNNITARLRAIVFESSECGGLYNYAPLSVRELDAIQKTLFSMPIRSNYEHFVHHLYLAVNVTASHPIWNTFGQSLAECLFVYVKKCHERFMPHNQINNYMQIHGSIT